MTKRPVFGSFFTLHPLQINIFFSQKIKQRRYNKTVSTKTQKKRMMINGKDIIRWKIRWKWRFFKT